jgi:hypothetical protein
MTDEVRDNHDSQYRGATVYHCHYHRGGGRKEVEAKEEVEEKVKAEVKVCVCVLRQLDSRG